VYGRALGPSLIRPRAGREYLYMGSITITEDRSREIRIACDRALRRLDRVIGERDDVLLRHARELVLQAAELAAPQSRQSSATQM
jgi:hypothetical protein